MSEKMITRGNLEIISGEWIMEMAVRKIHL